MGKGEIGIIILLLILIACNGGGKMKLESPAFEHEGNIPSEYTCDGEDKIPELRIKNVPEKAKSFVLICEDPDAPMGTWDHWVAWNIPVTDKINSLAGAKGKNSWGRLDYGGPCPPSGEHRYYFSVYALDTELELAEGSSKEELKKAMEGHVIEEAVLMGKYSRQK